MAPYKNVDDILHDLRSTSLVGPLQSWNAPAPQSSIHISPSDALGRPTVIVNCINGKIQADLSDVVHRAAQAANNTNTNIHINIKDCEMGLSHRSSPSQCWVATPPSYPVRLLPSSYTPSSYTPSSYTPSKPNPPKQRKKWLLKSVLLGLVGLDILHFVITGHSVILMVIFIIVILVSKLLALVL